ncbi:MAG: hypothetical protein R2825_24625 [Saprospiraceae bacterium]
MTKITTQRLQLLALNKPSTSIIHRWPSNAGSSPQPVPSRTTVDRFWRSRPDAIEKSACSVAQHPDHFEWFSHWVMIRQRQIGWSAASASADCRTRGSVCWLLRG